MLFCNDDSLQGNNNPHLDALDNDDDLDFEDEDNNRQHGGKAPQHKSSPAAPPSSSNDRPRRRTVILGPPRVVWEVSRKAAAANSQTGALSYGSLNNRYVCLCLC